MAQTVTRIRTEAPRIYSRELVDLIFSQPYCRISNLVDTGLVQRQSASVYLNILVQIGVLEARKAGRERLFINTALLQVLMQNA